MAVRFGKVKNKAVLFMKGKNLQAYIQELTSLGFALVDITRVLAHIPRQGKHIFRWAKSLFYKNRPLDYGLPWLTYDAVSWLDSYLSKEMTVFEWGGGSSTIYFAKRVKLVISVEHDWEWYKSTSKFLTDRFLRKKTECIYKPPRKFGRNEKGTYTTNQPKYSEYTFAQYCQTTNQYPNDSFDLVLVDGEARNDCIRLAKRKVRAGGIFNVR